MSGRKHKPLPLLGAGEPDLSRRSFLRALGISGVVGLTGCEQIKTRALIPYLVAPEDVTPGVPVRYASTCAGCPAACGLMITARDGRPIKLEGHPDHPLSRGGLCALGQAEIRGLYDAGRLRAPTIDGAEVDWAMLDAQVRTALARSSAVEVIANSITSPSARRAIAALLEKTGGQLTEIDVVPGNATAVLDAYQALDGRRVLPSLHLEKADLIVALASDFLGAGPDPVAQTAGRSARRAQSAERGALKHVQIEATLSLTGAAADERWQASASQRKASALYLLAAVARRAGAAELVGQLGAAPGEPPLGDRLARLADYLWTARGRSLVISGSSDVGEQIAVAMLNRVLGNEDGVVDLELSSEIGRGDSGALDRLRARLEGGGSAIIAVGIDPVDQLPDGDRWAEWLAAAPLSVAITDRPTATARASKVVAAAHHGLESWSDFRPRPDVWTLAQPTISPLWNTRHPYESFLVWAEAGVTDYREHVRQTWRELVYSQITAGPSFEEFWFQSVRAGAPASPIPKPATPAQPPTEAPVLARLLGSVPEPADLEVELVAQVAVRDGSRAFNPWLRELPDPISRVAWTPTIAIAPSRAAGLDVSDGDVVRVATGDRSVAMPVRVSPGQHPDVLGVPVGYGRLDGDRSDHPRNGYRLQPGPAKVSKTGEHIDLPLAQIHSSVEGRHHVVQVTAYDQRPSVGHHGEVHSLWGERPVGSPHWHMAINLDACTGCSACVIACQAENNTPVVGPKEVERYRSLHWIRIDRYFVGDDADNPEVLFQPMLCAQCDNAPCETVCPVAATVHSHDGLNHQAYNRCVGTRYCANNCPYKVRRFNWFEYDRGEPVERMVLNPDVVVRERGVMEKCTFCVQRIQLARIDARASGQPSFEVKTACQQSCPADAIEFGDDADPSSRVSRDRHDPRAFQALAEVGVKPSITYLARVRKRES